LHLSKRKKRRGSRPARGAQRRQPPANLEKHFRRADNLINHDRAQDAVDLLEPLLASHGGVADLRYYLGYARVKAGDLWGGLADYERALDLGRDPSLWLPLSSLYAELGLRAHALHAFRQVLRHQPRLPMIDNVRAATAALEQELGQVAAGLDQDADRFVKGLREMEEGQRALQQGDYPACIAANRRAIKFLRDWPPPRNNLSLALFFDGQPEEAIATAREVLARHPDNVQALSNAVRYLAWTNRENEARALWARLRDNLPEEDDERLKAAEAAAILGDDERVYELLKPLDDVSGVRPDIRGLERRARFFLAVAEANLGKRTARRRLQALLPAMPWIEPMLQALKEGRRGSGWAEHFPYFRSTELLPGARIQEFVELIGRRDEMPERQFESEMASFARRYPQLILMAEKLIWEEMQPDVGVSILAVLDTPAAHAALRRFGLSQAGEDDTRMRALSHLVEEGVISQEETLRFWSRGEWRHVQVRQYTISGEPQSEYAPEVADLLNEGLAAFRQEELEKAKLLFERALKLDPSAKQAYNNLATIHARRGEHDRAKELWRAALEVDPLYVFPRCNLASYLLDDGDVEGAQEMLRPLTEVTQFHPQEMAFYSFIQARILIKQGEYEAAENALKQTLELWPDYKVAEDLLGRVRLISLVAPGLKSWQERQQKRDAAWRARLQAKLTTSEPSLVDALPLYSKEALTAMARVVVRGGHCSTLRKAELMDLLVEEFSDADNVQRVVAGLDGEQRAALQQVMERGGAMPWDEFDARYGNDLDESRYWQWHEPKTVMGQLRKSGLLVEAAVDGELLIVVPRELRPALENVLAIRDHSGNNSDET
jgi:tetratricopeptide (TPR) repeat protein